MGNVKLLPQFSTICFQYLPVMYSRKYHSPVMKDARHLQRTFHWLWFQGSLYRNQNFSSEMMQWMSLLYFYICRLPLDFQSNDILSEVKFETISTWSLVNNLTKTEFLFFILFIYYFLIHNSIVFLAPISLPAPWRDLGN